LTTKNFERVYFFLALLAFKSRDWDNEEVMNPWERILFWWLKRKLRKSWIFEVSISSIKEYLDEEKVLELHNLASQRFHKVLLRRKEEYE